VTKLTLPPFAILAFQLMLGVATPLSAHDGPHFSAGEAGDPKKPARTIEIVMKEEYGAMEYVPNRIEVKRNEQIRFVLKNADNQTHEFLLASVADNQKHAEVMKKHPEMVHDDPNGKTLTPKGSVEILWRFNKPGTFEFACLIPGHREAGMVGTVVVK
jgi:uncharacterized cupredoxin-like copper-binding protein